MAFNLYFAFGLKDDAIETLFNELKCHRLFSYYNDPSYIASVGFENYPANVFIDSGAYSAYTHNTNISIDKYIQYVNDNDDTFDYVASLDKIPGNHKSQPTREECNLAAQESWGQYLYITERVKSPQKVIPIFHQGEDFKYLENLLTYRDLNGRPIEYIGIGTSANWINRKQRDLFIQECFNLINKLNPTVKCHAFGMTDLSLLEKYNFESADSTTWCMAASMGEILTDNGRVAISNTNPKNRVLHEKDLYNSVLEQISKYGYTIEELADSYVSRMCYNICYLQNWADNYSNKKLKPHKKLF